MSISLQKGQKVSLSKDNAGLSKVIIGLGWDEVKQSRGFFSAIKAQPVDCDASALVLQDGKLKDKKDIIYFGNLKHKSGMIQHMGDNLTGAGAGDDEQIVVDLAHIPAQYDRIVIVVNIINSVIVVVVVVIGVMNINRKLLGELVMRVDVVTDQVVLVVLLLGGFFVALVVFGVFGDLGFVLFDFFVG